MKSAKRTPLKTSSTLNTLCGREVYLKLENLQKTGSFKIRGAANKVQRLTEKEAELGVIAASAGNHAQGVAYSSFKKGISAVIYMPESAPLAKIEAVKAYGAEVVISGQTYQESYRAALQKQKESGRYFIHAFDDPDVIAGQGTVAAEMLQQQPELDTIVIPVGGGGLIAGMAACIKTLKPSVKVIGVQAAGAAASYNRFKRKFPYTLVNAVSIADGIAVKEPGMVTFPHIEAYVDDMVTVSDEEIASAIVFMAEREKMLTEGAGAASLAAVLYKSHLFSSSAKTGAVISGGNMDIDTMLACRRLNAAFKKSQKIV
ncbi:threonine ammonia-lyase [Fictibacillus aquaticus]|uniref:L-threonine dehydratase catabolic TdcB n=2 Tax=Fictibacillus aquaticus TaxID=2021314 RepID=A0A235FBJ7_9BACL|nr:threonine ammonia-lyase [Fictibacillus aquaticus]